MSFSAQQVTVLIELIINEYCIGVEIQRCGTHLILLQVVCQLYSPGWSAKYCDAPRTMPSAPLLCPLCQNPGAAHAVNSVAMQLSTQEILTL